MFEVFHSFGIQSFNITEAATEHDDVWINNINDVRQAFGEIKAKTIDCVFGRGITSDLATISAKEQCFPESFW